MRPKSGTQNPWRTLPADKREPEADCTAGIDAEVARVIHLFEDDLKAQRFRLQLIARRFGVDLDRVLESRERLLREQHRWVRPIGYFTRGR